MWAHDPRSAQDRSTSSEKCTPVTNGGLFVFVFVITNGRLSDKPRSVFSLSHPRAALFFPPFPFFSSLSLSLSFHSFSIFFPFCIIFINKILSLSNQILDEYLSQVSPKVVFIVFASEVRQTSVPSIFSSSCPKAWPTWAFNLQCILIISLHIQCKCIISLLFKVVFLVFIKVVSFTVTWVDWIEENKFSFEAPSFKHKLWNRISISWLNFKSSRLENIKQFILSENLFTPSHEMIWWNFKIINLVQLYARFQS